MIITRLIGGLGNQMFQYAVGRSLAHYHNTDLFLDVTEFESNTLRKYELNVFKINASIAASESLKRVPFSGIDLFRLGIQNLLTGEPVFLYVKEKDFAYHKEIKSLPDTVCLDGFWQSEKYFLEIRDIISKEFSLVDQPSRTNQELIDEIKGCNSVSMHIRRGDYVSNPVITKKHGVLGIAYYKQALENIKNNINDPQMFVFSDDISWVRNNLKIDVPFHFIDHNGAEKACEDLRLISTCKHHIIANSSFSWWGAWLSKNPDKMVFAPKKWFNQNNINTQDLIPDSWYKI